MIIVIGAGVAGLSCALAAAAAGAEVALVVPGRLRPSLEGAAAGLEDSAAGLGCAGGSTVLAQGGIAAALGADDSPEQHLADTVAAGVGLVDVEAAGVLVDEGAMIVRGLLRDGFAADLDAAGRPALGLEAAHGRARIVHAGGDRTGALLHAHLSARVLADAEAGRIELIENRTAVALTSDSGAARGVVLRSPSGDSTLESRRADAVVLATGGYAAFYERSTNPASSRGEGVVLAARAGAVVSDLEFVQFHPTILASPGEPFLVSEAVRGEGATLIDDEGRRFAFDAHPDGELAPRDVVARAIARQAAEQHADVRLDATVLSTPDMLAKTLARRFPTIDRVTRERGFDWAREPIPVTPAAHYLMGGIVTDLDGRTSVPGLFAVGEAARTGVHGANRLASNSLLEGAVFGARAAAALDTPAALPQPATVDAPGVHALVDAPPFTRAALQQLMWDHVGLLRTVEGMTHARAMITRWRKTMPLPTTVATHEDANLLLVADATASAALARTSSVGAHHLAPAPALIGL